jgi:hypothetical protein
MVHNLKENLDKYGKVEIYITNKPDLIVTSKTGDRLAIEVETGIGFRKHKTRFYKKYLTLKEEYGNDFFVLITNSKYKDVYKNLIGDKAKVVNRSEFEKILKKFNNN